MRAVIQRVRRAVVTIGDQSVGAIGRGFVVLAGFAPGDAAADVVWMAEKIAGLRLFADEAGKMNLDLAATGGAVLVISQFTLYGDATKGRRPSFVGAAHPGLAEPLYRQLLAEFRRLGVPTEAGEFGADMQVELVNDGPVTLILERHGA